MIRRIISSIKIGSKKLSFKYINIQHDLISSIFIYILTQRPNGQLYNNNNSIQFFIIYVPSQQLQGQLQTQHSVDTGNNNNNRLS
jgi:hypothetical protein